MLVLFSRQIFRYYPNHEELTFNKKKTYLFIIRIKISLLISTNTFTHNTTDTGSKLDIISCKHQPTHKHTSSILGHHYKNCYDDPSISGDHLTNLQDDPSISSDLLTNPQDDYSISGDHLRNPQNDSSILGDHLRNSQDDAGVVLYIRLV